MDETIMVEGLYCIGGLMNVKEWLFLEFTSLSSPIPTLHTQRSKINRSTLFISSTNSYFVALISFNMNLSLVLYKFSEEMLSDFRDQHQYLNCVILCSI